MAIFLHTLSISSNLVASTFNIFLNPHTKQIEKKMFLVVFLVTISIMVIIYQPKFFF